MKIKFLILPFLFTFMGAALFFLPFKKQDIVEEVSYDRNFEDELKIARFKDLYEELDWVNSFDSLVAAANLEAQASEENSDIYSGLKFLSAIISGDYLDYLDLFIDQSEYRRLGFNEFQMMHKKIDKMASVSIFTKQEFKDILFYGLILGEIESSLEFKNRAWVYDSPDLAKILLSHSGVLPTLDRFSKQQIDFLRVILDGFRFEGVLDKYRNGISYDVGEKYSFFEENVECFDISFLLFICRIAGKYRDKDHLAPSFSTGFHSLLFDFQKDYITHLQQSS